jgi:hypothetical protein
MPRRTAPRCPVRGTAADELDAMVEFNLCNGSAFDHWDLRTRTEFARPWEVWGDEITRRWRIAFPGSRPFAMYVLGLIPPATWVNSWPALRHPLRSIEGCTVRIADTAWHKTEHELAHLDDLGLIDNRERRDANRRLAEWGWSYYGRYEQIARD